MPVFRYFVVIGALLLSGLYILADRVSPPPLPSYFGQTAEMPKPYHESREFAARRSAPLSETTALRPSSVEGAVAKESPATASKPDKLKTTARHIPRKNSAARVHQAGRVRTVSSDMMVTIRSE